MPDENGSRGDSDARPRSGGAMTLSGLLVLLAVVLILAVVVFPIFVKGRDGGPSPCLSNVKQISMALLMYDSDWNCLPPHKDWDDTLYPYIRNPDLFICPRDRRAQPGRRYGRALAAKVWRGIDTSVQSYDYNAAVAGRDCESIANPAETIVVYEARDGKLVERHHDGANYGFADGHAKWMKGPPPQFLADLRRGTLPSDESSEP